LVPQPGWRIGAEVDFMKRHAFKMKLKPGVVAEYKRRHDEIWPELSRAIRAAGISDYSIFLDEETLTLFAVQKQTEDNTIADLPSLPIVKKWWAYMAPLMEVNADHSPQCGGLKEVFHLD
jgi:L-rhamnose mutarotase